MYEEHIELSCEPEELQIEGNCSVIDPETDRAMAEEIRAQLRAGNEWAWCAVQVTVTLIVDGERFIGHDSLGGCSYASEADFRAPGGSYDDMVSIARHSALESARAAITRSKAARRLLREMKNV